MNILSKIAIWLFVFVCNVSAIISFKSFYRLLSVLSFSMILGVFAFIHTCGDKLSSDSGYAVGIILTLSVVGGVALWTKSDEC